MKNKKYICSDLVKLWSALVIAIVLMLTVPPDWGWIKITMICSFGGVFLFYITYLIFILLLGIIGIDVVDKFQYDIWKKHALQGQTMRILSYKLYGGILTLVALICAVSFADYNQDWNSIILEWVLFGFSGFLVAQIIMRIIFLSFQITTDKGDIEDKAREIEIRNAERRELKKQQKKAIRRRSNRLDNALFRGLGFGAGWGMFDNGGDDSGQ